MAATPCALCGSFDDYTVLYEKNFDEADLTARVFSARRMPDRVHYRIVRCRKDNLVRSNPVVDEATLAALYADSAFTYADETANLTATYLRVLGPALASLPLEANILEIGCGSGFLLERLFGRGYKNVYGVEPSRDAAGKACEAVRGAIVTGVVRPGMFAEKRFQLICFFQTFDHVRDPNGFLDICAAMLAPGGAIVVFNHDVESASARILKEKSPIIDIAHTYLYSKDTMRQMFMKHDLRPVRVFSPANTVSLKHLLWLLPVPGRLKTGILQSRSGFVRSFLRWRVRLRLGNVCLIAKKIGG